MTGNEQKNESQEIDLIELFRELYSNRKKNIQSHRSRYRSRAYWWFQRTQNLSSKSKLIP